MIWICMWVEELVKVKSLSLFVRHFITIVGIHDRVLLNYQREPNNIRKFYGYVYLAVVNKVEQIP